MFLLSSPWSLKLIIDRFELSPIETLSVRLQRFEVGLHIWSKNWLSGSGAGDHMEMLYRYDARWTMPDIRHNTNLWIGSEVGILGLIGFHGAIIAATRRYWRLAFGPRAVIAYVSFGAFIALVAFVVEGVATPIHREPTAFTIFWYLVALSVALPRIRKDTEARTMNVR